MSQICPLGPNGLTVHINIRFVKRRAVPVNPHGRIYIFYLLIEKTTAIVGQKNVSRKLTHVQPVSAPMKYVQPATLVIIT